MADKKIVLYDLQSKLGNCCWSPNVWKTRALLNCKNISYETEWLDFPDIEPTLRSYGIPPASTVALGANVGTKYTLPTLRMSDGSFIMDSVKIASEIERIQPKPPMHLELGLHEEVQTILRRIAWPLYPEIAPPIRDNLLTERGKPHWVSAREKLFGMAIDEVNATKGGELAWAAAKPGIDELVEFMKKHKRDGGPFVLGSEVSYADIVILAFLMSVRKIGNGVFERLVGVDEVLRVLWRACQRWVERDS